MVNASSTSSYSDDTNWISFSPTPSSNTDDYLADRTNNLLDFDGFVSNAHNTGGAKEAMVYGTSSETIDVTNPFAL